MKRASLTLALSIALVVNACSSVSDEQVQGTTSDGGDDVASMDASGDGEILEPSGLPAGRGQCGPAEITTDALAMAEARLPDATVAAFEQAGLALAAPENWVLVSQHPSLVVVADPLPLVEPSADDPVAVVWVRALAPEIGLVFDDACRLGDVGEEASVVAEPASCTVASLPGAIAVTWPPADGVVVVERNGEPFRTLSFGAHPPEVDAALDARREAHTEPDVSAAAHGYVDLVGPDTVHSYELAAPDGAWRVGCGTIAASPVPEGSGPTAAGDPSNSTGGEGEDGDPAPGIEGDTSLLQRAATEAPFIHTAPYEYVTLVPICDDCGDEVIEMYLVPGQADPSVHVVEQWWRNGEPQPLEGLGVWGIDPLLVPDLLLREGSDGWEVDPDTLLVTSWAVEGEGAVLQCFEIDTSPIDLREERCGAANRLGP